MASVPCDLQFVLRVLLPSSEAGRKEVTTRLADFAATNPSMTPRLAFEVERDPAFAAQWLGIFLPYWRGEADRYLTQSRDFPIGVVFPLYRSATAALERSRLAADAEQLFKVATHHAPFEGDLLSRAIDALSRGGVLHAQSASVATALAISRPEVLILEFKPNRSRHLRHTWTILPTTPRPSLVSGS